MDVYAVFFGEYAERCLFGVYTTREKALATGYTADIEVYSLDGGKIHCARWWRVSYNIAADEWAAIDKERADAREPEARVVFWDRGRYRDIYPQGRVDLDVFSDSEENAVSAAKDMLSAQEVPVFTYAPGSGWVSSSESVAMPAFGA